MKILIVSHESWRNTNNGGNVLSNIFCSFQDAELAQVYCSGEEPQNDLCQRYYQISESLLLTKEKGRVLPKRDYSSLSVQVPETIEGRINRRIPAPLKNTALLAREIMWSVFNWKTTTLERFVTEFQPDLIFAPCYYYYHVSKVALYVKRIAGCPMISYISDDNYSLKQISFSPSFYMNRLITRKWIRRMFAESALIYTMTELQKREYESIFHRPMKVLCKHAEFAARSKPVGDPICFLYAGNLLLNRWRILVSLADALSEINASGVRAQLHIFSSTVLSERTMKKLNDGTNTIFHGLVSYQELEQLYRTADVAVFVESFDLKNRLVTRLSFSTKIIDCLNSGCAVLAVGPETHAGMTYLKEHDAAICVNSVQALRQAVQTIVDHPGMIDEYAEKAIRLGRKNHMKADIEQMLRKDFSEIAAGIFPAIPVLAGLSAEKRKESERVE